MRSLASLPAFRLDHQCEAVNTPYSHFVSDPEIEGIGCAALCRPDRPIGLDLASVAQQLLHGADVVAVLQQVGRERVTQGVTWPRLCARASIESRESQRALCASLLLLTALSLHRAHGESLPQIMSTRKARLLALPCEKGWDSNLGC